MEGQRLSVLKDTKFYLSEENRPENGTGHEKD